jgi:hypothetical protein
VPIQPGGQFEPDMPAAMTPAGRKLRAGLAVLPPGHWSVQPHRRYTHPSLIMTHHFEAAPAR